jgi:hypothetical protein
MAASAFLPWASVSTVFGQIELTGLQVAKGGPGMVLLAIALVGGLATLFSITWGTLIDYAGGGIAFLETGYAMSRISSIAAETTTSYVRSDLGSGGYLAIASSFLVIVAGAAAANSRSKKATTRVHAKPRTGLRGPFLLNEQTVNEEVGYGSPGAYALGNKRGKTFIVRRFGRSDTDINARLKEYIGKYDSFKFEYLDSPEAAFTKECELYHAFRGPEGRLDNTNHPDRSQGTMWQCPKCNVFGSEGAAQAKN